MTRGVLSLPVPKDDPHEQLKVPLRTLPSSQLVRLVFPTSQVLATWRSWAHAQASAGPGLQSASFRPCRGHQWCKGRPCESAWGARAHGDVLGYTKATVGRRYPAFLILVLMVSRSH